MNRTSKILISGVGKKGGIMEVAEDDGEGEGEGEGLLQMKWLCSCLV